VNTPSTSVSPGLGGFLAFFLLAIALWLLMRNMNKRMRRMTYREEQEAAARAKRGEAPATSADGRTEGRPADSTDVDGPSGPGDDRSGPEGQPRPRA
jgi:flagellar biosynthesis/type III secretory pathway M-ring protein FliF/YscJ